MVYEAWKKDRRLISKTSKRDLKSFFFCVLLPCLYCPHFTFYVYCWSHFFLVSNDIYIYEKFTDLLVLCYRGPLSVPLWKLPATSFSMCSYCGRFKHRNSSWECKSESLYPNRHSVALCAIKYWSSEMRPFCHIFCMQQFFSALPVWWWFDLYIAPFFRRLIFSPSFNFF